MIFLNVSKNLPLQKFFTEKAFKSRIYANERVRVRIKINFGLVYEEIK